MTALSIQPTFPIFTDIDGQPLEAGLVWIGVAGANPIANPQTAYWDAALTQPVTQPVATRGGYPMNAGAIGRLYVNGDYSILVRNRSGSDLYSALTATERYSDVVVQVDSSDVTFLQAGSGAVVRTAQAKMRDVVSVLDFGAVGDGVVDDTAEIQAAVDAVFATGGGTVYFPVGTYKITSSISMKLNVCLLGASGRASRIVQHTNSTSCLSFTRNNGIFNGITSLGFTINPGVTGVTLLNIGSDVGVGGVGNINITSCNFNGGATAINIDAGYYINIFGSYFANQTAYGVRLVGDGGANANNITGCNFNSITGYAVYIVRDSGLATFQVTVSNNNFEAITGDAIYCPQTGVYTFSSNYFEAITGSEIVVPGTANVSGIGNYSADGATILNFSNAARGVFAVSPITASGDVRVNVGGTVITSNGNTQLDITNSAGSNQVWNLQTTDINFGTAGRGLNFNANANAPGMTSELLNWYEEGTWIPSLGGNAVYDIQVGKYVRIGRLVYVYCQIRPTTLGTGSAVQISGLPFNCADSNAGISVGYFDTSATACNNIFGVISGTSITLYPRTGTGANVDSTAGSFFQNNARIVFTAVYET